MKNLHIKLLLISSLLITLRATNVSASSSPPSTAEPEPEGGTSSAPEPEGTISSAPEPEGTVSTEPQPEGGNSSLPEQEVTVSSEPEPEGENSPKGEPEGELEGPSSEPESGTSPAPEPEGEPEVEPEGEPQGESEVENNGTELEMESGAAEPEGGSVVNTVLTVTLYSLIIVMILVGNILVALTIMKSKTLRTNTTNLYLLSLVTARASIAIFVIPARITGMFSEEYLGSVLCKLCHFAAMGSSAASIFSVVSIAITKYIQVTDVKARALTMKESVLVIILIWFLGFSYAIREAIVNDLVIIYTATGPIWSCTTALIHKHLNKYFIFIDIICLFLVPLVVILFCYSRVIKALSKTFVSDKGTESNVLNLDKQSYKAIRMLVTLMILFTICTISPMILKLYVLWGGALFENFSICQTFIYMFSYSNSWFNLIVFAYFRDDLREAFVNMCCYKGKKPMKVKEAGESPKEKEERDKALRMMEF